LIVYINSSDLSMFFLIFFQFLWKNHDMKFFLSSGFDDLKYIF
jgi:hypothetical protein